MFTNIKEMIIHWYSSRFLMRKGRAIESKIFDSSNGIIDKNSHYFVWMKASCVVLVDQSNENEKKVRLTDEMAGNSWRFFSL